jgi:hypothetical protein
VKYRRKTKKAQPAPSPVRREFAIAPSERWPKVLTAFQHGKTNSISKFLACLGQPKDGKPGTHSIKKLLATGGKCVKYGIAAKCCNASEEFTQLYMRSTVLIWRLRKRKFAGVGEA